MANVLPFVFQFKTRLIFGNNSIEQLGSYAAELGSKNILLVTDQGIVQSHISTRAIESLESAGLYVNVFDRVIENPTTQTVDECTEFARNKNIDLIVGLGGGSSMDTAKGCNFLLSNGGTMRDYWGKGKATKPMLPMIAVPTTAGTGSECQSFALITDTETHRKMACGDTKATPVISILDPTLTLTQPPYVMACTGMDAITHALETAVTNKKSAISWLYSREAFRLTNHAASIIVNNPNDLEARGEMLLGASYAGIAIENSMLGSAHAMANPLTANFDITHGQAVGMMLPHIIWVNSNHAPSRDTYHQLALDANLVENGSDAESGVEALIHRVKTHLNQFSLKKTLSEFGIQQDVIPLLAQHAKEQWTGNFNPIDLNVDDYCSIYYDALGSVITV